MARSLAPMSSILYFFKIPCSESAMAKLSAVWPPIVGKIACGLSLLIIFSKYSTVRGST